MKTFEMLQAVETREKRFEIRKGLRADVDALKTVYRETRERTPAETVAAYIKTVGYSRAAVAVATLVNRHAWDCRISRRAAAWAAALPEAWDEKTAMEIGLYVDDVIHLAHFDQIVSAFMKAEPDPDPDGRPETISEDAAQAEPEAAAPEAVQAEPEAAPEAVATSPAPEAQEERPETISDNERKEGRKTMKFEKVNYSIVGRFENGAKFGIITRRAVSGYTADGLEGVAIRKNNGWWYVDHIATGMIAVSVGSKTREAAAKAYIEYYAERVKHAEKLIGEKKREEFEKAPFEDEVATWETVNYCSEYEHRIDKLIEAARRAGVFSRYNGQIDNLYGVTIYGSPEAMKAVKAKIEEYETRDAGRKAKSAAPAEPEAAPEAVQAEPEAAPEAIATSPAPEAQEERPETISEEDAAPEAVAISPEEVKALRESRKRERLDAIPDPKTRERVAAVLAAFPAEYERLYKEDAEGRADYSEDVALFEAWMETPICREFIGYCANVRGDIFSSDRECAALVAACRECNARRAEERPETISEDVAPETVQAEPEAAAPEAVRADGNKPARGPAKPKDFAAEALTGRGWCIVFDTGMQRTRVIVQDGIRETVAPIIQEAGFYWSDNMRSYNKKLTHRAHRAALALAEKLTAATA